MLILRDIEFWSHVDPRGPVHPNLSTPCWVWTASRTSAGYGNFRSTERGSYEYAHRFAYEALVEQILPGHRVDHKCFNEACVNPDHLRQVSQKKNGENRKGAPSNNSSGVRGVSLHKKTGKWRAYAVHNDRQYHFGLFVDIEDAKDAVVAGRARLYGEIHPCDEN